MVTPSAAEQANRESLKAMALAARQLARHADGDFTPDPAAARFPDWPASPASPTPPAFSLAEAHELWAKQKGKVADEDDSARAFRARLDKLAAFLGHDDATRITPRISSVGRTISATWKGFPPRP